MGLASLQVCMESSDWFQGAVANHEVHNNELMIDTSSSSPSGGADTMMLTSYPGPPSSRVLRPPHDHALNCPRCDSTHTKFCYYNNYSLTQPRYFCKTCRRYWTKGGTLRNIPVGGGCRKNKKITHSSKKEKASSDLHHFSAQQNQVGSLLGAQGSGLNELFLPIDFMECSRNDNLGMIGDLGGGGGVGVQSNFNGLFSPFGYSSSFEGVVENYEKIMNPYEGLNTINEDDYGNVIMDDVKPNTIKLFDNWQNNVDKDSSVGLGSWTSLMNNRF